MKHFLLALTLFLVLSVVASGTETWVSMDTPLLNWVGLTTARNGSFLAAWGNYDSTNNIYYSNDTGASWYAMNVTTSSGTWSGVAVNSNATQITAISSPGPVYMSYDSGDNWSELSVGLDVSSSGLLWSTVTSSASGQYLLAGSENNLPTVLGAFFASNDYGATWIQPLPDQMSYVSAAMSANGQYSVVIQRGESETTHLLTNTSIWLSRNFGVNYTRSLLPVLYSYDNTYSSVCMDSSGRYLVAARSGAIPTIYYSHDYGATWNPSNTPSPALDWFAISSDASGANVVVTYYYSGYTTEVWHSSDYGVNWDSNPIPSGLYYWITYAPNSQYIYTSNYGRQPILQGLVLHVPSVFPTAVPTHPTPVPTHYPTVIPGSETWQQVTARLLPTDLYFWTGVAASWDGQYVIAIASDDIWTTYDWGENWYGAANDMQGAWTTVGMSGNGMYSVVAIHTPTVIKGVLWQGVYGCVLNAYELDDHTFYWHHITQLPSLAWNSVALSGNGTYVLVAGSGYEGLPGAIYVSNQQFFNFVKATAPDLNYSSVAVSSSGQFAVASVSNGGIWLSNDYGTSFYESTAPVANYTAVCISSSGASLVAVVSGGGIWYSLDAGTTWSISNAPSANWTAVSSDTTGQYVTATASYGAVWLSSTYGASWYISHAPTGSYVGVATVSQNTSTRGGGLLVYVNAYDGYMYLGQIGLVNESSAEPTLKPTVSPTIAPSVIPSVAPTMQPSLVPTVVSSAAPSLVPTDTPSAATGAPMITMVPSLAPSITPTSVPSASEYYFTVTQNLFGIDAPTFDASDSNALVFITSSASSMPPLTTNDIAITSVENADAATTMGSVGLHQDSYTGSCVVVYTVTFSSASLGFASATAAYDSLTNSLTSAVNSGQFTAYLNDYAVTLGAPSMVNTSTSNVTTTSEFAVRDDDNNNHDDNGDGTKSNSALIIELVVGVGGGLLVVCLAAAAAAYYRFGDKTRTVERAGLMKPSDDDGVL